jgi:hypothetical protein
MLTGAAGLSIRYEGPIELTRQSAAPWLANATADGKMGVMLLDDKGGTTTR